MSDIAETTLREHFIDLGYVVTDYERNESIAPYADIVNAYAEKIVEKRDRDFRRQTYEKSDTFVIERTSPDTLQNVLYGLLEYYLNQGYTQEESPEEPDITAHLVFIKDNYRGASITFTLTPSDRIIITETLIYMPFSLGVRSN